METVYVILGILVFLGIAYAFLMILITPYIWFAAYMVNQEKKHRESRESFQRMLEEHKAKGFPETGFASPYKPLPKGIVGKVTQNQVVVTTTEWLVTWGLFLAIEMFLAWNLYKVFEIATDNAFSFIERFLGV